MKIHLISAFLIVSTAGSFAQSVASVAGKTRKKKSSVTITRSMLPPTPRIRASEPPHRTVNAAPLAGAGSKVSDQLSEIALNKERGRAGSRPAY